MNDKAINSDLYLITCKENYFKEVFPADPRSKNNPTFITLFSIAGQYIEQGRLNELADFLMESQYFINLWTAHFILEQGNPDEMLKQKCLIIIKDYSGSSLHPIIADLETKWLITNDGKFF